MSAFNVVMLLGAVAGIVVCYFVVVQNWDHVKSVARRCRKQLLRLKPDTTPTSLSIPPGPPESAIPTTTTEDGVTKRCVMYVMCGGNRLLAYEVTREGFPGTRFVVERHWPNQLPRYKSTPDRIAANTQWLQWYREWQAQPNAFGGASGTFGKLPW
jgi:hypothetical protein